MCAAVLMNGEYELHQLLQITSVEISSHVNEMLTKYLTLIHI